MPRIATLAALAVLTSLLTCGAALGDADPASDVLLGASVFYPYSPTVSAPVERRLNSEVAAAAKAGFPIKVALIASPVDLGAIPALFGKPRQYASFLDQEISFSGRQRLLVVMPRGYGVAGLAPAASAAASSLAAPRGSGSDALATAATVAVMRLAAASGHRIVRAPEAGGGIGGGSSPAIPIAALGVAAMVAAAGTIAVRRRRALRAASSARARSGRG